MFRRLFTEHPASLSESYVQHLGVAARFGGIMIVGGLGALVHAVIPGLCTTTGSDTIARLHAEMVAKRRKTQAAQSQMKSVEYVI